MLKRTSGFTLIEMMIVVALVAVLASLAGPSFRQLVAKQRVKSVASALSEAVWTARSEALKRNTDVTFTFTTAAAGWTLKLPDDTTLVSQEGFPAVTSVLKNGSSGVFAFNAYGRLGASQTIELHSANVASAVKCVTVSQAGKTMVKDSSCS